MILFYDEVKKEREAGSSSIHRRLASMSVDAEFLRLALFLIISLLLFFENSHPE